LKYSIFLAIRVFTKHCFRIKTHIFKQNNGFRITKHILNKIMAVELQIILNVTIGSGRDNKSDGSGHSEVHGFVSQHQHGVELPPADPALHVLPLGNPRPSFYGRSDLKSSLIPEQISTGTGCAGEDYYFILR
jgi:hypothetical protein